MGQGSASKYHRTGCFICPKPQESPVPGCTSNYHLDIYRNSKDAKQPYEQAGEKKLCRLCGNNQHDAVGCFIYPTQVPCSAPCSLCKNIRYCFMQKKGAYIEKKYQVGIRSQPQTPRRPCKKNEKALLNTFEDIFDPTVISSNFDDGLSDYLDLCPYDLKSEASSAESSLNCEVG